MNRTLLLAIFLLLPILGCGGGCASPAESYVAADESTYRLFVAPDKEYPSGRIPAWLAHDLKNDNISQEEYDLMMGKLLSWKDRIDTAKQPAVKQPPAK